MFNLLPQIQQKIQKRIMQEVFKRITISIPAPEENIERPYRSTRIGFGSSFLPDIKI